MQLGAPAMVSRRAAGAPADDGAMARNLAEKRDGGARVRRARLVGAAIVAGVAVGAAVLWYFQPQAALVNHRVNQAAPAAGGFTPAVTQPEATSQPTAAAVAPAPAMTTLLTGSFQSLEHPSSGRALVLGLPDGSRYLRLEDLQTSSGPDVHVVLSPVAAGTDDHAYSHDLLELGDLQGNQGNQNYPIPAGTDLAKYRSAVIYCRRFSVGFAVAGLNP